MILGGAVSAAGKRTTESRFDRFQPAQRSPRHPHALPIRSACRAILVEAFQNTTASFNVYFGD
jgi:hypothetical protein